MRSIFRIRAPHEKDSDAQLRETLKRLPADQPANVEFADFFRRAQQASQKDADQGKALLKQKLDGPYGACEPSLRLRDL